MCSQSVIMYIIYANDVIISLFENDSFWLKIVEKGAPRVELTLYIPKGRGVITHFGQNWGYLVCFDVKFFKVLQNNSKNWLHGFKEKVSKMIFRNFDWPYIRGFEILINFIQSTYLNKEVLNINNYLNMFFQSFLHFL